MIKNNFNFNFSFSKTVKTFFLTLLGVMVISVPELKAATYTASTLAEFKNAVNNKATSANDVVQLTGNITSSESFAWSKAYTWIIDLNGYSLGYTSGGAYQFIQQKAGKLIIKDSRGGGRLYSTTGATGITGFRFIYLNGGDFELQSGTIDVQYGANTTIYAVKTNTAKTFTMTGGTIQVTSSGGPTYGVHLNTASSSASITGGTISVTGTSGQATAAVCTYNSSTTCAISGGRFYSSLNSVSTGKALQGSGPYTISGGYYSDDNKLPTSGSYKKISIEPSSQGDYSDGYRYMVVGNSDVARVKYGSTEVLKTSLSAAFTEAKSHDGAVITLLANCSEATLISSAFTAAYTYTLDLNNKTATCTGTTAYITKGTTAKLIITDNSTTGGGMLKSEAAYAGRQGAVYVTAGEVELRKGTIYAHNTTSNQWSRPVDVYAGTFTMTGGHVYAYKTSGGYSNAIYLRNTGTANISGGQVSVTAGTYTDQYAACVYLYQTATCNISGGKFISNGGTTGSMVYRSAGTCAVTGGYYSNTNTNLDTYCSTGYHPVDLTTSEKSTYSGCNYKVVASNLVTYGTHTNGNFTIKVADGTAASANKYAASGQTIAIAATPSSGYNFSSWTIKNTSTNADVTSTLLSGSKSTTASTSFTMPAYAVTVIANFVSSGYTVTYGSHTNGSFTIKVGSGSASSSTQTAASGATITLAATANTGYHFTGWSITGASPSLSPNATTTPATFTMPSANVTVNATFEINTYTISYAAGTYGSGSLAGGSKTHGVNYTLSSSSSAFTRTGYTYDGWSTNTSGSSKDYNLGGSYTTNAAQTFYPHWVAKTTAVTLDRQGGTTGSTSVTATYGSAMPSATMPTRAGYTFNGYFTATGGSGTKYYNANGSSANNWNFEDASKTLYAYWTCVAPSSLSIASTGNKWDFCNGESMTLTVSGTNVASDAAYQWQKYNGSTWDNIAGATSASYTTSMTAAKAGQYRCTVTNGSCSTTSGGVWVRVWQLHLGDDDYDFTYVSGTTGRNTTVALSSDTHYEFKLKDNNGGWFGLNSKTVNTTIDAFALYGENSNVNLTSGLAGNYTFTINYSSPTAPTIAITYPTANQAAGYNIYFDKSVITGWTSESASDIYLRIGKGSNNKNNTTDSKSWTLVPGTDRFYTITTLAYDGFEAWQIANNASWTGGHSIYLVNTGDGYAITKATNFQKYVVGSSGITIVPTTYHNTDAGCDYWNVSSTTGMLTHTATITAPSHGTITIANAAQSLSQTTTKTGIPHRTKLTVTSTPATGYQRSTLTVNGAAFTSGNVHILAADATIAATFSPISYSVKFNGNGATSGSMDNESFTYDAAKALTTNAFSRTGYTFAGWATSDGGAVEYTNGQSVSNLSSTNGAVVNLYAKWTENMSTVSLVANPTGKGTFQVGGSTVTSTTAGVTTTRSVTAVPITGYHFTSWSISGGASVSSTGTNPTTVTGGGAGAAATLTANFAPDTYTVYYNKGANGTGDNTSDIKTYGVTLTLKGAIFTRTGYTQDGWSTSDGGEKVYNLSGSYTANSGTTLYPHWSINTYTVTIVKNVDAYGTISRTSITGVPYGSAITVSTNTIIINGTTVTATPAATMAQYSYAFSSWSNASGTVTAARTITANFTRTARTYTVTLNTNGGTINAGNVTSYTYGTGATLPTNVTLTGYEFAGWYNNSELTGDRVYSITASETGNKTYWAKWVPAALRFTKAGNWNVAANWTPACVPTAEHDVIIQKPCTVTENAVANSVVIDKYGQTGQLTIAANIGLNVTGTIRLKTAEDTYGPTTPSDLILLSSASGNASLIFNNSNNCQATVQMYSKAVGHDDTWNWQYVGTAFTGTTASPNYNGSWLYQWKYNDCSGWTGVYNADEMLPWIGYCLTQPAATVLEMTGTLLQTDGLPNQTHSFPVGALKGTPDVFANSWTAPIQIKQMTGSDFVNVDQTIYLFNTGNDKDKNNYGQYITIPINSAGEGGLPSKISSMQGFYVRKANTESNASVTLNYGNHVRPSGVNTINNGPMYAPKRNDLKPQWMKLVTQGNRYGATLYLFAREDFTRGYDAGWDGENINSAGAGPLMYSPREDGTKDAVSAIPAFEGALVGFQAGEDSEYTFSFTYEGDEVWYLNDLLTQTSTLINASNTYTFLTTDNDELRFIISATPLAKVHEGIDDAQAAAERPEKVLVNDKLYIKVQTRTYDATGKLVENNK